MLCINQHTFFMLVKYGVISLRQRYILLQVPIYRSSTIWVFWDPSCLSGGSGVLMVLLCHLIYHRHILNKLATLVMVKLYYGQLTLLIIVMLFSLWKEDNDYKYNHIIKMLLKNPCLLHVVHLGKVKGCLKNGPKQIYDFVKMRSKKDVRTTIKEINKIVNQAAIWDKMIENCQMADFGEKLGQL